MTVEFFGVRNMGQIGGLNKLGPAGETQKTSKSEGKGNVSFSSALQGATATLATGKAEDAERAARVQELKAQVANGQYEPDLNKVASSLLKFLVEG
ncbi:Anti-sigma-28 factor FlgM family protein [Desulfobulbus propionicus DSM 2032]|jgi:flagellar biosynthesis anti-sigma factor FlgM|uniref:Negative regulator of flagellin synthesis n=1 Tax=Desulfobulbus propionicus (strain ATCC 33891 / DSM 2032 / VKM B-1956 / 1pr3) TaxID=577650 RepID=A0A7U3YN17_DESPD|nr:flagellar biosynthesis anti-sigma factor FlgM [Desulfobulbus propionicus]ADW18396.1 Anti-sigma-28 factor FlgM family protein [Desulfobulbus propionicus DSM 2032]